MTTYTTIPDTDIDADSPVTESLMTLLRDNPLAIAEGATGAPKIQAAALAASITGFTNHRILTLSGSGSYTPPADVASFTVFVAGATGGTKASANDVGGAGGAGYSEKVYASPVGPYSYSVGARGVLDAAGGSTTFDVITVTGSGFGDTTGNAAGGVGSGGDFNATGGTGGTPSGGEGGGGGGAGSRCGTGGNGGDGGSGVGGGGGGTGGNAGASGATGGAGGAAGTETTGISDIPTEWSAHRIYRSGSDGVSAGGGNGGNGASAIIDFVVSYPVGTLSLNSVAPFGEGTGTVNGENGDNGTIIILEELS